MDSADKGCLYVISGPSGTGKGSICNGLLEKPGIALSVSMTTRDPRPNEVRGQNYHFVDRNVFQKIIAEDGFYEYAEIFGEYYGTPKAPAQQLIDKGLDVILEIDVDGSRQIKEKVSNAVLVFVMPPSPEELRRRMEGRGTETQERIDKRLARSGNEIAQVGRYDYCVINDILEEAIEDTYAIILTERLLRGGSRGPEGPISGSGESYTARAERLRIDEARAEALIESYKNGSVINTGGKNVTSPANR